jgi:hypothetical protein
MKYAIFLTLQQASKGSQEAAVAVIEAIWDVKRQARAQVDVVKAAHAEQIATLKAAHQQAIAELTTKHTAEADELRRQLTVAQKEAAEVRTLRQRLYSCAHASEMLAAAVKGVF